MFRKIVHSLVCFLLVITAGAVNVNAAQPKATGMFFIDKPFKKEGLRFQVTVTEIDNPKYDSPTYHVNTIVTNISRKPITYTTGHCYGVTTRLEAYASGDSWELPYPESEPACPTVIQEKTLKPGRTIEQDEYFRTDELPDGLTPDSFELNSSVRILVGPEDERKEEFVKMQTKLLPGLSLNPDEIELQAESSVLPKSYYELKVTGKASNNDIKRVTIQVFNTVITLRIDSKSGEFSTKKKVKAKGPSLQSGVLEVTYNDGTKHTYNVPIENSSN
ncbi:hypothetical protein ABER61_04755 [Brevibacillus formosus]|uniref:Uncharacterized protein n=1 Tax=Brevibacillus formosus TaxID=54913 RepID=A0A837KSG2_9BACL|nr:hypothetical protein [Brevibacillus formosus]KLI00064.1 hypothetical protein AA984_08055 [Brevibacillus formosus]MED1959349.1 hypothetical protein [Brevibacillus formosus]PSJ96130.1 hypothetical protein C7R91_15635 [Brevibacillus formosus]GED56495.1 hypothetical protein BFO01nite_06270 [Brevibacillus formosus]